jgi:carboxyl-terminal processing protease
MEKDSKWLATGVVLLLASVCAGIGLPQKHPADTAFAQLSPRERNLAIFDAACRHIEEKYFNREFLQLAGWQQHKAHWRARAETELPVLLYRNVLQNLVHAFPNSHFAFTPPPAAPAAGKIARKSNGVVAHQRALDDVHMKAFSSSPGFSTAVIRRKLFFHNVVDELVPGSNAEHAGISPGWIVLNTETNLSDKGVAFSARFLRLNPGEARLFENTASVPGLETPAQWNAYVEANAFPVEYEMKVIEPAADFETRVLPGGVTYLRFDSFAPAWLGGGGLPGKAMDVIDAAGPGGLILDLRRNLGGRALELERIAGRLLGDDVLIGYQRGSDSKTFRMEARNLGRRFQGPLVVLIGPSTMSAAEIIAAAVQDHHRGKLIGRATSGSVAVGNKFALPDGGSMIVPVGDFQRIDERSIENVGVHPDIWLMPTLDDVRAGRDPVLERALQEVRAST